MSSGVARIRGTPGIYPSVRIRVKTQIVFCRYCDVGGETNCRLLTVGHTGGYKLPPAAAT
jgi:hypothetical protein